MSWLCTFTRTAVRYERKKSEILFFPGCRHIKITFFLENIPDVGWKGKDKGIGLCYESEYRLGNTKYISSVCFSVLFYVSVCVFIQVAAGLTLSVCASVCFGFGSENGWGNMLLSLSVRLCVCV